MFLDEDPSVHEPGWLRLDSSRAHVDLGWTLRLPLGTALDWVTGW